MGVNSELLKMTTEILYHVVYYITKKSSVVINDLVYDPFLTLSLHSINTDVFY